MTNSNYRDCHTIVGIDPSLTGLAVCLWRRNEPEPQIVRFSSIPAYGLEERMNRYQKLSGQVIELLTSHIAASVPILIEGYSFGSVQKQAYIGEFGGILRQALLPWASPFIEVTPATLKKFATGKGAGKKDAVIANVAKRWGAIFNTSDEVDAYVLGRMARIVAGWDQPETAWQREAVEVAVNGKPKKAKRRRAAAGE